VRKNSNGRVDVSERKRPYTEEDHDFIRLSVREKWRECPYVWMMVKGKTSETQSLVQSFSLLLIVTFTQHCQKPTPSQSPQLNIHHQLPNNNAYLIPKSINTNFYIHHTK